MLQVPLIQRIPQAPIHHLPGNGGVYVTQVEFQLFNDMVDVIRNVVDGPSAKTGSLSCNTDLKIASHELIRAILKNDCKEDSMELH